jgi:hypothetical protein
MFSRATPGRSGNGDLVEHRLASLHCLLHILLVTSRDRDRFPLERLVLCPQLSEALRHRTAEDALVIFLAIRVVEQRLQITNRPWGIHCSGHQHRPRVAAMLKKKLVVQSSIVVGHSCE